MLYNVPFCAMAHDERGDRVSGFYLEGLAYVLHACDPFKDNITLPLIEQCPIDP